MDTDKGNPSSHCRNGEDVNRTSDFNGAVGAPAFMRGSADFSPCETKQPKKEKTALAAGFSQKLPTC